MSNRFAAEVCPNCDGKKLEPLAVFDHPCDFCKGADGKPTGFVSHFKKALWISLHPEKEPKP